MRVILTLLIGWSLTLAAAAQELQSGDIIAISVYQDPKLDRQIVKHKEKRFGLRNGGVKLSAQE